VKRLSRNVVALSALCTGFLALCLLGLSQLFLDPARSVRSPSRAVGPVAMELTPETWVREEDGPAVRTNVTFSQSGVVLGLDTRGVRGDAVSTAGIRTSRSLEIGKGVRVEATLDWRAPNNACYRQAGLSLSSATDSRSACLEVVGVPPGARARVHGAVTLAPGARPRTIYTDGWPQEREGRSIGHVKLGVEVSPDRIRLFENGREIARTESGFSGSAVLRLYTKSHSNYEERPVAFEKVLFAAAEVVARAKGGPSWD
jgi:hypothetical protein